MPMRVAVCSALLVLIVLVSGCQAPFADQTGEPAEIDSTPGIDDPSGTETDEWEPPIRTVEFDASYDPETVVHRVEALRGLDRRSVIRIEETEPPDDPSIVDHFVGIEPTGAKALRLYRTEAGAPPVRPGYSRPEYDMVIISVTDEATLAEHGISQEAVLAHEIVHALQFQHHLIETGGFFTMTTDEWLAHRTVVEGDAILVEMEYVDRYVDGDHYSITEFNTTEFGGHWTTDLSILPYYYGASYLEPYSLTERTTILADPPTATSGLLDPATGVDEPTGPLPDPVTVDDASLESNMNGSSIEHVGSDRVGALVLRTSLRSNGVPYSTARNATSGWRNDRMDYFRSDAGHEAVQLSIRWSDDRTAERFERVWLQLLGTESGDTSGFIRTAATDDLPPMTYHVQRDGVLVQITASSDLSMVRTLVEADAVECTDRS